MQNIIVEKPYRFLPPLRSPLLPWFFQLISFPYWWLRFNEGVVDAEIRGLDKLKASLAAGHSILLAPNHPRTADPVAMGFLSNQAQCAVYAMGSWHLFQQSWLRTLVLRAIGGFSVNREGVDRQAINVAIELLAESKRPLIIFPEGATSRTADHLHALLDGVAFIARAAAKKRSKANPPGKVVVQPIAVKYLYRGDLRKAADDVLTSIEHRLSWQPQQQLDLLSRVAKVAQGLLSLKEIEYFGQTQTGTLAERLQKLIDRLLGPLEERWLGGPQEGLTVPRVRLLRTKILPEMVAGKVDADERQRRWRDLGDLYLAQQLSSYPPEYLTSRPSVDRVLETIEKFEEDLTDKARLHGNMKVILQVGDAIEVSPERDRKAAVDPLMVKLQQSLQGMMDQLALESPPLDEQLTAPILREAPVHLTVSPDEGESAGQASPTT